MTRQTSKLLEKHGITIEFSVKVLTCVQVDALAMKIVYICRDGAIIRISLSQLTRIYEYSEEKRKSLVNQNKGN